MNNLKERIEELEDNYSSVWKAIFIISLVVLVVTLYIFFKFAIPDLKTAWENRGFEGGIIIGFIVGILAIIFLGLFLLGGFDGW